jgi:hypothetical protein
MLLKAEEWGLRWFRPRSVSRISGKSAWMGAERDGGEKTRVLAKVDKVGMKT